MYINELAKPQLLVIYPGRFMPWHKGHHAVYQYLTSKFGRNNVYIATSNRVEPPKSPFTFSEKSYFMQLTGVAQDRIVQATQPYQIDNVLASGQIHVANPANTVAIFAVSQKDMAEDPRFKSFTKKDGTPAFFQKMPDNIRDTVGMTQHAYIMTVPTFDFTVLGQPMQSGTELRKLYSESDEQQRQAIIRDLFGRYTREAEQIMDAKIPTEQPQTTGLQPAPAPVSEMDRRGFLKAAGVGLASTATGGLIYNVAKKGAEDDKVFRHYVTDPEDIKHYKELQSNYNMYVSLSTTNKAYAIMSTHAAAELDAFVKQMQKKYNFSLKTVNETGGVGVVANKKQARDPRYSMSLTRDVRPGQINKNLKAFDLAETVDVDAIHAEALREHLLSNPALYENREDFQLMREFLSNHATPTPVVNKSYIYMSVQSTPISKFNNLSQFSNLHKLVKLDDKYAYFDINGTIKRFPETGNLSGDSMSQIYFFESQDDAGHFNTLLKLKFVEYKQTTNILDKQDITEDLAWVRSRLGEGAVDALTARHIEYIGQDIAALKQRIATESLPANYVDALKKKIAQLEQERAQLAM